MLQGIGDTFAETLNLTDNRMIELFLFEFNFASEAENQEALAYIAGVQQTKASAESSVTNTLTLSTQFVDWAQLGFAVDQFPTTETNIKIPTLKTATVPSAAAYEVSDAAITTANDAFIKASINSFGSWGQPGPLTRTATAATAPAAAGEVQVDTTNNKLVFNSTEAGAGISYIVPIDYTSIESYGGANSPTSYGKISFRGKLFSTESTENWGIYFPSLSRNSRPSIELTSDTPTLTIEFAAETPSGWPVPYQIFNFDTGVTS